MQIQDVLEPWSPWLGTDDDKTAAWKRDIPSFQRPVFVELISDINSIDQMISITGPRRVGKSTLQKQIIQHLVEKQGIEARRVIYYSLDDPALYLRGSSGGEMIERLMQYALDVASPDKPAYLLLDEIQTLDRWEQYLKKYYDLNYSIRVVLSGSASSPIFKKSRESLLGRVKDYHLLPFSFREYLMYQTMMREQDDLYQEAMQLATIGQRLKGMFAKSPEHAGLESVNIPLLSDELWATASNDLDTYLVEGGFPEVWSLPTSERKIEYLYDNQVKKVITEDLVLAVEFRKPEQLKTFYISLLEQPGREVSMTSLSKDIDVNVQQIEKYLPLLEMTDLIRHASKFRKSAVRVRRGNQKFYPIDMALRNAVLRIGTDILSEPDMLGLYAENLVFNALKKWKGVLAIDYYREARNEVDFIVHTNPSRYWPVEVKYRTDWSESDVSGLRKFQSKYECHVPVVVTKRHEDFGMRDFPSFRVFQIPLLQFLLLFD